MDNKQQDAGFKITSTGRYVINDRPPAAPYLSKREYIATHLYAGYLASMKPGPIGPFCDMYAEEVVKVTDSLIKILNETAL